MHKTNHKVRGQTAKADFSLLFLLRLSFFFLLTSSILQIVGPRVVKYESMGVIVERKKKFGRKGDEEKKKKGKKRIGDL